MTTWIAIAIGFILGAVAVSFLMRGLMDRRQKPVRARHVETHDPADRDEDPDDQDEGWESIEEEREAHARLQRFIDRKESNWWPRFADMPTPPVPPMPLKNDSPPRT